MEVDFKKMADEFLADINDFAAEKFIKDYEKYSSPDGATDEALQLATISTAVSISAKLAINMMERYHEQLMDYLKNSSTK